MSDIEEQFYKTFGIEPIKYILPLGENIYWQDGSKIMQEADYKMFKIIENDLTEEDKKSVKFVYPEITDRKLLDLICIVYKTQDIELTIDDVKNEVLNNCIKYKDDIEQQVQSLFKEEE